MSYSLQAPGVAPFTAKTKEPTGYVVSGGTAIASIPAGVATYTGTDEFFLAGALFSKTNYTYDATALADGKHFLFWQSDGAGGVTLTSSTTVWTYDNTKVFVGIIYKSAGVYKLGEERHGCTMDAATHERLHSIDGSVMEPNGFTVTPTDTGITIAAGKFWDEDLPFSIAEHTSVAMSYFTGTLYQRTDGAAYRYYRPLSGSEIPQYLEANALANITDGYFGLYWIVATHWANAIKITSVLHTAQYPTIHDASQGFFATDIRTIINTNGVGAAEFRLLGCIITQRVGAANVYIEKYDLRTTSPNIRQGLNTNDEVRFEDVYLGNVTGNVLGQTHSVTKMLQNIDAAISEAVYYPASYAVGATGFTFASGVIGALQSREASTAGSMQFNEPSGALSTTCFVDLTLTSVASFNKLNVSARYDGGAGHSVEIKLLGQNGKTDLTLWTINGSTLAYNVFHNLVADVVSGSDYITAGGSVVVRVAHLSATGNTGHILYLDKVALLKAGTLSSNVNPLGVYADNAAAKAGGLVNGNLYRTTTGVLMVVFT